MKLKLSTTLVGLFSALFLNSFAGNKEANQMLNASAKSTFLFEENKGQIKDQNSQPSPDVLFSGEANGLVHHVLTNGISYQLTKVESMKPVENHGRIEQMPGKEAEMNTEFESGMYFIQVKFCTGELMVQKLIIQ